MEYNLTLVLGAGSSVAMGYPIGNGLRTAILEDSLGKNRSLICSDESGIFLDQLEDFVDTFRKSQQYSIDAFLAKRPEYAEIGKRAIAATLLQRENIDTLYNCNHSDNWYQYLLNRMTSASSWEELSLSKVAIITFNYDRSLEHYLLVSLMHSYGKTHIQAQDKLSEMKIIHVYGSLGEAYRTNSNYYPYGSIPTPRQISKAAAMLKVIPEGREDDATLAQARLILSESRSIGFLGFGFDELNLQRLKSTETCKSQFKTPQGNNINRTIVSTCYGMTPKERQMAANMTRDAGSEFISDSYKHHFMDCECYRLLRETLILDSI